MTPEQFIRQLAIEGGKIVSSNDLTPAEIALARACGRMLVLDDGLGFVYIRPISTAVDN